MKCFSLLFFLIVPFSPVVAQENYVVPKTNVNFSNGDRTNLIIESPLSDEELKKFENTKITDVIYAFKLVKTNGSREFEVIFSDPPKKPSEKQKPFQAKGINYTFDKERAGEQFIIFNTDYSPRLKSRSLGLIIYGFLIFLLGCPLYLIGKHFSELKKMIQGKKDKALILIDSLSSASTREDIENVFKNRHDYERLLVLDQENWLQFLNEINQIQFKGSWSSEELLQITNLKKKLGSPEAKDGI